MQHLTNKEIAIVFAMYLGCEVKITNPIYVNDGYIGILAGIQHERPFILQKEYGGDGYEYFNDCKLFLTTILSITDKHAIDFARLNRYITGKTDEEFIKVAKDIIKRVTFPEYYSTQMPMCYPYEVYMYLIQQGYAVPLWFGIDHWANGKTAIELEIAIDKNNLR